MCCIDLKDQFLSYVESNPHQSSFYNQPTFMKSCQQALTEVQTLRIKVKQLEKNVTKNRLSRDRDLQSKMLINVKQNMKLLQTHLKRISIMAPDMKTTNHKFVEEYKSSIVATLEMKLLQIGMKFKEIHATRNNAQLKNQNGSSTNTSTASSTRNSPNISRSLFLEQSQDEIMQEITKNQYMDIQKSINHISQMYKDTLSMVRIQGFMVDPIVSNIDEAEQHVEGGKRHLSEAYRRQSKNRPLIYKVFITLYILVFVYIVFLS